MKPTKRLKGALRQRVWQLYGWLGVLQRCCLKLHRYLGETGKPTAPPKPRRMTPREREVNAEYKRLIEAAGLDRKRKVRAYELWPLLCQAEAIVERRDQELAGAMKDATVSTMLN